jgi:hypothetical protein
MMRTVFGAGVDPAVASPGTNQQVTRSAHDRTPSMISTGSTDGSWSCRSEMISSLMRWIIDASAATVLDRGVSSEPVASSAQQKTASEWCLSTKLFSTCCSGKVPVTVCLAHSRRILSPNTATSPLSLCAGIAPEHRSS